MMETLKLLWAYKPTETAVIIALTIVCGAGMTILLAALLMPEEPDKMEET